MEFFNNEKYSVLILSGVSVVAFFFLKAYFIITTSVVYFTKEFASDSDFLKSHGSKQKYLLSFASGNAVFQQEWHDF